MKKLTDREEEIMHYFWNFGAMFVKEVLEKMDDPKPHYNTISTIIRTLEDKGFITHKTYGTSHQYAAIISREAYKTKALKKVISGYFNNSYSKAVSTLVKEEEISLKELKKIVEMIEKDMKK